MPKMPARPEFIALMAMMFATLAFSIDGMLPALPEMAETLTPEAPNRAQLVITSFVMGMGLGTFIAGPLSDSFGRKPVLLAGVGLFIVSAFVASQAQSLEVLMAARIMQGLGASGPRVIALAVIRDLYAGRGMAQIMSFVMAVFTLVPAMAPLVGAAIISFSGWPGVFYAFMLFAFVTAVWTATRLPETLAPEDKRPFRLSSMRAAVVEMFSNRIARISIAVQSLCFGILFSTISTIQPLFDSTFGKADTFPYWFCGIALLAATASILNAMLTVRYGMRIMVKGMLAAETLIVLLVIAVWLGFGTSAPGFAMFVFWMVSLFFLAGMTIGNINAIAMEPMGHIAGMAASVIGGVATVLAVIIAAPIGLMFDGSPLPLAVGVLVCCVLGLILMMRMPESDA